MVKVTREVLDQMCVAARAAHPLEACGLLLGEGGRVTQFIETRNVHLTPETHFEIDPQALIDAHRAAREGGPQVLGYFHSHPRGPAAPSDTDRAMAAHDGSIWAIVGKLEPGDNPDKKGDSEGRPHSDTSRNKGDTSNPQSDASVRYGVRFWRDDEAGFVPLSYALVSG